MKFVIQKVSEASVRVEGECIGRINRGFLVFVESARGYKKRLLTSISKNDQSPDLRCRGELRLSWLMWAEKFS